MTAMTIATRDLETLLELSDPQNVGGSVDAVWQSALAAVKAVVACDAVTLQIQDVGRQRLLAIHQWDGGYEVDADPVGAEVELYWDLFWSSDCSYPQRTGDYVTVTKSSDEFRRPVPERSHAEASHPSTTWLDCRVPLPMLGPLDFRVMLWRDGGRDFSERDVLLLSVLRPHLVAIRDATFELKTEPRTLTSRQCQLLGLLATGMTNRQAARQLGLSEHTVRKHLENIFDRLHVNSRTAAIDRAFPGARPTGRSVNYAARP